MGIIINFLTYEGIFETNLSIHRNYNFNAPIFDIMNGSVKKKVNYLWVEDV